jgi:hypothetical protein
MPKQEKKQPRPEEKTKSTNSNSSTGNDCLKLGCLGLGTIGVLLIIGIVGLFGYVWFFNPYHVKDWMMNPSQQARDVMGNMSSSSTSISSSTAENLPLNEKQLNMLKSSGVDLQKLKNKDPKELKNCAESKVGQEKLKKLMSGQSKPSITEMMSLKKCLE